MAKTSLLLVEDEPQHRDLYGTVLRQAGYDVIAVPNAEEAMRLVEARPPDLIVTDVNMPTVSGVGLLRDLVHSYPEVGVILFTSLPQLEAAVEAVKIGALDYLDKSSLTPPTKLAERVAAALQKRERQRPGQEDGFHGLVGNDPRMRTLFAAIRQVGTSMANVLIYGETGSGKELVARAIHADSKRAHEPFVTLDCSTLAPELVESELFGHEKGAFSGAVAQHRGRFERAHRGTLFLDEVANLSSPMQAKLLRVIETKTFERVGGEKSIVTDVRIVAATNIALENSIKEGTFRRDLYHRLNVLQLRVPPLRDRRQDIPELVHHFLARYASQSERPAPKCTPAAIQRLQGYDWPGNVRELENLVYRMVLLYQKDVLEPDDVDAFLNQSAEQSAESGEIESVPTTPVAAPAATAPGSPISSAFDLSSQVEAREKEVLVAALARNRYNLSRTAKDLNISRTTLYSKLHRYGIQTL